MAEIRQMEDKEHELIGSNGPKKTRIQVLEDYIADRRAELQALKCGVVQVESAIALHLQLLADEKVNQGLASDADTHHRSPMGMVRPKFKGMRLAEIIATVLSNSQSPMTTTELSHLIYDTQSEEELYRARNSLSTELRAGAKANPPRWQKIGRYAYAAFLD